MLKPSVSILGCGWLGLPLAGRLRAGGYVVKGSTTHAEKIPLLQKSGIEPFLVKCSPEITGERLKQFFHSQILILTIPFKRDLPDPSFYDDQIQSIIALAECSPVEFIIFSSSTAVYSADAGVVSESDQIKPDNPRSEVLLNIERSLLTNGHFKATVIRFAGLYGGTRELGRYMKTLRAQERSGQSPVNLIHLDDCVEIVFKIIHNNVAGEIFNAVSDCHPTRQELYSRKAVALGLEAPVFREDAGAARKIVTNHKLKSRLNYQFIHPDPLL